MGLLEDLYDVSPIFFQNIMVSISGYDRNRKRYGKSYNKHLKFLKEFDTWNLEDRLEYQRKELIDFVNYAVNNSKFYKKFYANINISSIKSIEDLKRFPVLEKEMLRENIKDIVTVSGKNSVEEHTGGTTGKSLTVLFTNEDNMKRMAILDNFKLRMGFENRKMKRATFNGKHIIPPNQKEKIFWRYNSACKQMIYSSFHITEENLKYYVESLNKYKPVAIDGFFMSICDIAGYIERHNIKLQFEPIAIFPTSETLTKSGRELLERVFKCKVYDQYASSEGAPFVTECTNQILHMELSSGVFEYYEDDNDEILVTSFFTHGTPLIRYRIGDSMVFDDTGSLCICGNESLVVRKINGRNLDFLYTAEGAKINGGNVANLFKNLPSSIIRAQVVQYKINDIIINLEIDKSLYKHEHDDLLKNEFLHKFGPSTNVQIKHVDEIAREKSGKYSFIKNYVELKRFDISQDD